MRESTCYLNTNQRKCFNLPEKKVYRMKEEILLSHSNLVNFPHKKLSEASLEKNFLLTRKKTERTESYSEKSKKSEVSNVGSEAFSYSYSTSLSSFANRRKISISFTDEQMTLINKINKPGRKKVSKRSKRSRRRSSLVKYNNEEVKTWTKGNNSPGNITANAPNTSQITNTKKELLKQEVEQYEVHYKRDLQEFTAKSEKHKFMVKHFPSSYEKKENFYLDVYKKNRDHSLFRRGGANTTTGIQSTNDSFIRKLPKRVHLMRRHRNIVKNFHADSEFREGILEMKKIWSPKFLNMNAIKIFVDISKKLWNHEEMYYSQEGVLEFLMKNNFNVDKTVNAIKNREKSFLNFISKYDKKIDKVEKISRKDSKTD